MGAVNFRKYTNLRLDDPLDFVVMKIKVSKGAIATPFTNIEYLRSRRVNV